MHDPNVGPGALPDAPAQWPAGAYDLAYADPPWPYRDKSLNRGGARRHYQTMTEEEIRALPVGRLLAPRAICFLWATCPNLPMAIGVLEAWGLRYVGIGFVWVKTNADGTVFRGMGHYTRANAELCLLGVRGRVFPRADRGVPQVRLLPRGVHSAKPLQFRADIDRLYGPELRRVELFHRGDALGAGWDTWGDQSGMALGRVAHG